MPSCKAKYCTVQRRHGISTFAIPDPKTNRALCEKWIHNLGTENLNIKTFVYSKYNIVCAKHFEEDCFKEDLQAKVLGYTPKRRHLKPDAVPTIFEDSKPIKKRESSERRLEKKNREEVIAALLEETGKEDSVDTDELVAMPSTSSEPDIAASTKRKTPERKEKTKKKRKTETKVTSREIGTQVEIDDVQGSGACNLPCAKEDAYNLANIGRPSESCVNCFARDHPKKVLSDHIYTKDFKKQAYGKQEQSTSTGQESSENMSMDSSGDAQPLLSPMPPSDEEDEQSDFSTPTKEYKVDPTYVPSDSDVSPEKHETTSRLSSLRIGCFVSEQKFIVFYSCLQLLLSMVCCNICKAVMYQDDIKTQIDGTCLALTLVCMNGHTFKWRSQPLLGKQPIGNILVTAATYITGNSFSKMESFSKSLKLSFIGKTAFNRIGSKLVIPTIDRFWCQQKEIILRNLRCVKLVVSGDGRCDSPGFSAKYCTYTIMEAGTSAVIGFNVVQVTEAGNSSTKMELLGFQRTMKDLLDSGMTIDVLTTDRHVQIRKAIREEYPHIKHQFDVWHLAKSVTKKLTAAAKKKGSEDLMPWVRSIRNHLWYCASHCAGDSDLLEEMWISIVKHIQNIHTFDGAKFNKCGHPELSTEETRKKKWLKKGSKALTALTSIVLDKRLLKDIRQLNLFCHTGYLESYHSMMLKYVPKRQAFNYSQMVARTQLAALDHNFNLNRKLATDAHGQPQLGVMCPKATGRWTTRTLYVAKKYDFRQELLTLVLERKDSGESNMAPHQEKAKLLPRNIAKVLAPSKAELAEAHVSRFKVV